MEYVTQRFENTSAGIKQKDEYTKQIAAQGYRIITEQIEQGHIKGKEQCCLALICLPAIFLAGRTPGIIIVTYGREPIPSPVQLYCSSCGASVPPSANSCERCGNVLGEKSAPEILLVQQRKAAAQKTIEAQKAIENLDKTLTRSIGRDHRFNWDSLTTAYSDPKPINQKLIPLPTAPQWINFEPKLSFLQKVVPSIRDRKINDARATFLNATSAWKKAKDQHDIEAGRATEKFQKVLSEWENRKIKHEESQVQDAESKQQLYLGKDLRALSEYWKVVSDRLIDFESLPNTRTFEYLEESQTLVVDCDLPAASCIPQVQEVKYIESRNGFETLSFSETWRNDFHKKLVFQIAISSIYALFQSDTAKALDSIIFNGRIRVVDKATGHEVNPCVVSVRTTKSEFMRINLSQVDPKACFKRLGGLSSANLIDLEPVVPILP
jgi:restriction system protein